MPRHATLRSHVCVCVCVCLGGAPDGVIISIRVYAEKVKKQKEET